MTTRKASATATATATAPAAVAIVMADALGLGGGGEGYGEEVVGVVPGVCGVETGGLEKGFDGGGGELVAVFGVDGFAGGEVEGEGGAA